MKILVVDDNKDDRRMLSKLLEGNGYDVEGAGDGMEALQKLKEKSVDLIISDILMPKMDGFRLIKGVKKDKDLKDIPFVFYTATYVEKKDEELALSLGASKFIIKPQEQGVFIDMIGEVMAEHKKGRLVAPKKPIEDKSVFLKEYNEVLIGKLEKKMLDLEKSERRYRDLCERISDVIFSLDEAGNFTAANCKIEIFGYKTGDVIGKHFTEILTPESRATVSRHFEKALKGEETSAVYEVEMVKKDGGTRMVEISMSTIHEDDKFLGMFGIARDITEKKTLEEESQKRLKELEDFYNMAVGRELKMAELEKEVEKLKKEIEKL